MKDRVFNLFVLSGKGIHLGLTAMYDCINLGIAKRDRTIKIGDNSFGTMKECVQQAHAGNDDFFEAFVLCLADKMEDEVVEVENDIATDEDGL